MSQPQPPTGGFTLIECAMAIVILATAMITGLTLMDARYSVSASHGLSVVGSHVLSREMELIRSTPYEKLDDRALATFRYDSRFQTGWTVTDLTPTSRTVVVTVEWSVEGRGALLRGETTKTRSGP